jgi:hypothetical protein
MSRKSLLKNKKKKKLLKKIPFSKGSKIIKRNKPIVDIVFCLPGKNFSGNWLKNWSHLIIGLKEQNISFAFINEYNSNVYYVRSQCLIGNNKEKKYQKPFENRINYKNIMWIDSDNIPTLQSILRLLAHDKDIVSGIYHMQGAENKLFATVEKMNDKDYIKEGNYKYLNDDIIEKELKLIIDVNKNKKIDFNNIPIKNFLKKVDYTGMGYMLVKNGVFEKIGYPWFSPEFYNVPGNEKIQDFMSEDVSFCMKAKKAGFEIFVDISMIVPHEKTGII